MKYSLIAPQTYTDPIVQTLVNRGFKIQDIPHYVNTTEEDILDPALLKNMYKGASMLAKHVGQKDKIFIQIDADCDGFTSAAILINWLHDRFPKYTETCVQYRIHSEKQHGIIVDTIPEDVSMVIIPDAGSNQIDEHKILFDKGIDVLVLDHHVTPIESPYACIINNQIDSYPNKELSGAGVVFKFCEFIDERMNDIMYSFNYLDLVALGIIADMVECKNFETKELINLGLENIQNPFFSYMVEKQSYSLGTTLTYEGIAFYVAPYVNATVRVGTQEEKEILFKSMLYFEGEKKIPSTKRGCKGSLETVAEQACRNCTNVKNRQAKSRDASLEIIENIIREKDLNKNKILLIQLENPVDKNLTGLIANQLVAKYQKPVLLLNKKETEDGSIVWEGSGRGYDKSELKDFQKLLNESGLAKAEGHENAFGASVLDRHIESLIQFTNNILKDVDFSPCYKVDFIFQSSLVKAEDIKRIAEAKTLWGKGVEEPLVVIENIKLTSKNFQLVSAMKNPTLKITISDDVNAIKFKSSFDEFQSLYLPEGCVTVNILGRCNINTFNYVTTAQLFIEDYEIVNKISLDF